jgi:hypothetical protein
VGAGKLGNSNYLGGAVTSHRVKALISQFERYSVQRLGTAYFCRRTALEIVDQCETVGIRILGIDGFYLTPSSTEQPIEWILDLSEASMDQSAYNAARQFLEQAIHLPLFFELVLADPVATSHP